jgi:hypothetical protein
LILSMRWRFNAEGSEGSQSWKMNWCKHMWWGESKSFAIPIDALVDEHAS